MRLVERFLFKLGSRKFWILVIATAALFLGKVDQWGWIAVASVYIGANVLQKAVLRRRDYYSGPGGE